MNTGVVVSVGGDAQLLFLREAVLQKAGFSVLSTAEVDTARVGFYEKGMAPSVDQAMTQDSPDHALDVTTVVPLHPPAAGYAVWFHSWWGSYTLSQSSGFYLWGRVSSFADCDVIKPPASEQAICPSGTPSSRTPPSR